MKQTTREKIIQCAVTVLATNPLASLDEIAEAAGVGRATLYRHFESRSVLIRELMVNAKEKMDAVANPILKGDLPARERLDHLVRAIIPLGASLKIAVFEPFCRFDPEFRSKIEEVYDNLRKFCRELKVEGVVAVEIPDAWLATSLDRLVLTAWENIHSGDIAAKDAPGLVLRTFLDGNGPADNGCLKIYDRIENAVNEDEEGGVQ